MAGLGNLKKKRRIQVISMAALLLIVSVSLMGYAFRDGINYYRSPSEVLASPPNSNEVFRMGGLVADGSIRRGQGEAVTFSVTDGAATVPAVFVGVHPDLFAENQGMIGTGRFVNGVFEASEILAKHDENYMPKEVIDSLKETGVYVEPSS